MLRELREAMNKLDGRNGLTEYVELDEGFFETVELEEQRKGEPQYPQDYLNEMS